MVTSISDVPVNDSSSPTPRSGYLHQHKNFITSKALRKPVADNIPFIITLIKKIKRHFMRIVC